MTIKRRLATLEARATGNLPLSARAWLGHKLTPADRELAQLEVAQNNTANINSMSKEVQVWLAA